MATKKLTTSQKIDLLLDKVTSHDKMFSSLDEKVTGIKKDVSNLQSDVTGIKKDVSNLQSDVTGIKKDVSNLQKDVTEIKTEVKHLIEMSSKALIFGAEAKDRLDDIDQKISKKSFTPFTSGAFVA